MIQRHKLLLRYLRHYLAPTKSVNIYTMKQYLGSIA